MQENNPIQTPVAPVVAPQVVAEQPKQSNFLVILLSVLLLLSILIAGFFAYQTQKLVKELTVLKNEPTPTAIAKVEPTSDPGLEPEPVPLEILTKDWKMYTHQMFTIKLPSDWSTTDTKNPIQFLNYVQSPKDGGSFNLSTDKGKVKVEIYQNNTTDSLEKYVSQQKSNAIETRGEEINWQETKAMVDGKEAIRVKTTNPGFTYYVKDVSSNTIFSIAFTLDFDNYDKLSDQILSTFKFTN